MDGILGSSTPRSGTITVLVVDDHPVVREGLVSLLTATADIDVVGTACDGAEAVELAALHRPRIVLMDLSMPNVGGAEATGLILSRTRATRVVVLTAFNDREQLGRALATGASSYVLKDAPPEQLREAVRAAAR